jgi:hypothetical protein
MKMKAIRDAVREASNTIINNSEYTMTFLGDEEQFYKPQYPGHVTWTAKIHMALQHVPKGDRYKFLGKVVGRPITSTKELTLAEAIAIYNARDIMLNYETEVKGGKKTQTPPF